MDQAEYLIDVKLYELVNSGDLGAIKTLQERKDYQKAVEDANKAKREFLESNE